MSEAEDILRENKLLSSYWGKRIRRAEKRSGFSPGDVDLACSWITCACGKLGPRIPRGENPISPKAPNDTLLSVYGFDFGEAVATNNFKRAAYLLVQIEKRAVEVLKNLQT